MSKIPLAREFMATSLVTLRPEMAICDAISILLKHRVSGASVVDESNRLLGILSEKDCLRVFANGAFYQLTGGIVADYMSKDVTTIGPDDDLFKIADIFLKNSFRRLPVLEGERLVGQISRRDVLLAAKHMCTDTSSRKTWSDSKYLSEEVQAVLQEPVPDKPKQ